jgi:DNA repair exonuclease SbcCD ATPase subunit
VGKQTGIRERVGWIIPNQHMPMSEVCVELELNGPAGTYVINRRLRPLPKKSALEEILELTLPDESILTGDEAHQYLATLLQSSFRDFLTTVYQHQESIRAVLTQEPKDRNDAIDRLLGLSGHRNLLGALDSANLRSRQKGLSQRFTDFEDQIKTALAARNSDLIELRDEAQEAGLARNQLTAKAAVQSAKAVALSLQQFAKDAEIEHAQIVLPDAWTDIMEFEKAAKKSITQLRGQVPGIEEQNKLHQRQKQLLAVQTSLEKTCQGLVALQKQVHRLDQEHGGEENVAAKIVSRSEKLEAEQIALRQANGRAAVINEAIEFLEGASDDTRCPVCGSATAGLLGKIRGIWAHDLQALVERIKANIDQHKELLKQLRAVAAEYKKWGEAADSLRNNQAELREQVSALLNVELTDADDPLALIKQEFGMLEAQLKRLGLAIQQRQEHLNLIEQDLSKVRLIRNYLHLQAKKEVVESLQKAQEFADLDALRNRIAELVEDNEAIKAAVATMAREEAVAKLTVAEQSIDKYFRQLSCNPAVEGLKLAITTDKRTQRNGYDITDQDGNDLLPVLSQGDLNALALAIFLGLAAAGKEGSPFGFLILDDPSQSLGSEHKKHLAHLLDQVAKHKKLIVATMDAEFHEYLMDGMTKAKTEYRFGEWTPEHGPTITVNQNGDDEAVPATSTRSQQGRKQGTRR